MKKIETIYLAAALRDKGGGRIEAGLIDLVAIREGDALQTLADGLPESFDLVLLDGAKGLYADIFKLAEASCTPARSCSLMTRITVRTMCSLCVATR